MVRFSTETFWLSLLTSWTVSVGTPPCPPPPGRSGGGLGRNHDLPHRALLVERLHAVLEVLLDLLLVPGVGVDDVPAIHGFSKSLGDALDDGLPDGVHQAEVAARQHHEAQRHRGSLEGVLAVGPLDALELAGGMPEEGEKAARAG